VLLFPANAGGPDAMGLPARGEKFVLKRQPFAARQVDTDTDANPAGHACPGRSMPADESIRPRHSITVGTSSIFDHEIA
jgi:hypothetical protein